MEIGWVATSNGRPEYLKETIASWEQCPGWSELERTWFVEPSEHVEEDIALQVASGAAVMRNSSRLGPLINPFKALSHGFNDYEFVILAEDDATVYPDTMDYFWWASEWFEQDPSVMFVCSFQKHRYARVDDRLRKAEVRPGYFAPTIWGTWRSRWNTFLRATWDHDYRWKGWDWNFTQRILPSTGRGSVVPMYSRSQHIGKFGGAHCTPDMFESLLAPEPIYEQVTTPWSVADE